MRYFLLFLLLTIAPVMAQPPSADLPPDPQGVQIVDRAMADVEGPTYFYAVLFNQGGQSHVDVYKGLPWKRIHRWDVTFQDEKVEVQPNAVLSVVAEADAVYFFWKEFVGYREGAVSLSLTYDRNTGKFSTSWSD